MAREQKNIYKLVFRKYQISLSLFDWISIRGYILKLFLTAGMFFPEAWD
jgi:hypothetical protein